MLMWRVSPQIRGGHLFHPLCYWCVGGTGGDWAQELAALSVAIVKSQSHEDPVLLVCPEQQIHCGL